MVDMFQTVIKIPHDRLGVLIGVKGSVKKQVEDLTNTRLFIDSFESLVKILSYNSLDVFQAQEIVKAIARGFNPKIALLLLNQDYYLEIINLKDFARTRNSEIRLKARVIGEDGKVRKNIERLANVFISIYGKTISIIGAAEQVANARHALDLLLRGAKHSSVYRFLELRARQARIRSLIE